MGVNFILSVFSLGRLRSKELAGCGARARGDGIKREAGGRPALDTERSFNQLILFLNANSAI